MKMMRWPLFLAPLILLSCNEPAEKAGDEPTDGGNWIELGSTKWKPMSSPKMKMRANRLRPKKRPSQNQQKRPRKKFKLSTMLRLAGAPSGGRSTER